MVPRSLLGEREEEVVCPLRVERAGAGTETGRITVLPDCSAEASFLQKNANVTLCLPSLLPPSFPVPRQLVLALALSEAVLPDRALCAYRPSVTSSGLLDCQ